MKIKQLTEELLKHISNLPFEEKVDCINVLRREIHDISPFKSEPVDLIQWVKHEGVHANSYNPNHVNSPELELLKLSIEKDGYTQPVVTMPENGDRVVIDGFHRTKCCKTYEPIQNRVHGYLPVVTINSDRESLEDRMAATVRHNRARGKHKVESMSEIVMHLKKIKWNDNKIAKHLEMGADEVLRLTQITGLTEAFKDREFSEAWEPEIDIEE